MTNAGGRSLWEATAPPVPQWPVLRENIRAQVAIIGAGYTGLSAALHLAETGIDVVVLDGQAPGWGGSGRNGGQVIAGLKDDPDALAARFGETAGERIAAFAGAAPDLVFDLIDRHAIACEARRSGWLQLAVSTATMAAIAARATQWQVRGAPVSTINQTEAARLTGATIYVGGALDRRGGTVQPLAYALGLAQAAGTQGARIFAQSPATSLRRDCGGWVVATPFGQVTASTVIIATNAYTGALWPGLRESVVTLPSFQIASDPLPAPLRAQILPERQSASDTRRLLRYFRLDEAGRLVVGARGVFGRQTLQQALRRHLTDVRDIFPQAAELPFPYQWGGNVAITTDHLPHVHELAPGLLTALGYNGRGVALATAMGTALAAWAAGAPPELPATPLRPVRLHRLGRLGAMATVQYMRARDRIDHTNR